ncbi:MAG: hypothetical protein IPK26_02035 [Planctomycetes bacterium]|nr:hypothetical protein [Planctomycetota bacterium]
MEPKPPTPRLPYAEIEERMWRDFDAGRRVPLIEYLRLGGAADQKRIAQEYLALPSSVTNAEPAVVPLGAVRHAIPIADPVERGERLRLAERLCTTMQPLRMRAGLAPLFTARATADGIELEFPAVHGRSLADAGPDVALDLAESAVADEASAGGADEFAADDDVEREPQPPVDIGLQQLATVIDKIQRVADLVYELHGLDVVHGGIGMDTILVRPGGGLVLVDCGLGMLRGGAPPSRQDDIAALGRLLVLMLEPLRQQARNWSWVARQLARWLMQIGQRTAKDPTRMPTPSAFANAVEQALAESERSAAATGLRAWLLRLRRAGPK